MNLLRTCRRFFPVLIGLLCTFVILFTSAIEYVMIAPLYVGSLVHDLTYKDFKFSCNYQLNNITPEIYIEYTHKLNWARNAVLDRNHKVKLQDNATKDLIILNAKSTEDYQQKIDALGDIITVTHKCKSAGCGVPELTRYKWGTSVGLCPENLNSICENVQAKPLDSSLEIENPTKSQETQSNQKPEFYLHVIPNGTVGYYGFVQTGNVLIVPEGCINKMPVRALSKRREKEVFVITQYWGEGWYHGSIENIPRLAAYVAFLKENTQIKIHVHKSSKSRLKGYFGMLGIDANRVVKGLTKADIVYLPQGGGCGQLHEPSGYILMNLFQTCLANFRMENSTSGHLIPVPHFQRNLVILIKRSVRSQGRGLVHFDILENRIRSLATKHNLDIYVFSDTRIPSFPEVVTLFQRAVLIVGPHGAGLSNMVFSQPQTYIVEILCRGAVNLCYADIAYKVGMHYRGIISKTQSCKKMEFDIGDILYTAAFFLADYRKKTP